MIIAGLKVIVMGQANAVNLNLDRGQFFSGGRLSQLQTKSDRGRKV